MAELKATHFFENLEPAAYLELESTPDGTPSWLTLFIDGRAHGADEHPIFGAKIDLTMHFMGDGGTDDAELVQARAVLEQLRDSAQAALDVLGQGKLDV